MSGRPIKRTLRGGGIWVRWRSDRRDVARPDVAVW